MNEDIQIRTYGDPSLPTLVYLPGLHGDWTLVTAFRMAVANRVRFVEITYPETTTGTIEQYANKINQKLLGLGIASGWLLGESFGSQVAWALLAMNPRDKALVGGKCFRVDGLILAGGFVKYFWSWGPRAAVQLGEITPMWLYKLGLKLLELYANLIHRNEPEVLDSMMEFIHRRTKNDLHAMRHRLVMLDHYDARPVARQTRPPVYFLDGLWDALVPWFHVCRWLGRNCPGYEGRKILWWANHVVLHCSPKHSANLVTQWMKMPLSSRQ